MNKEQFIAGLMLILYMGTLNPLVAFGQGSAGASRPVMHQAQSPLR
jgi:hypothetical protein